MNSEERSNEEIRADVAAVSNASGGLCYSTGGTRRETFRLAKDVAPLLARLAAVERERDSLREDVKIRDAEITRQHGIILALDNDADQALIDRDEAIEAESQAGDRIAAERDAAIAENARLLARIAAVEALHSPKTFDGRSDWHHSESVAAMGSITPRPHDCTDKCFETFTVCNNDGAKFPCSTVAALAASPTPTGPEPTWLTDGLRTLRQRAPRKAPVA